VNRAERKRLERDEVKKKATYTISRQDYETLLTRHKMQIEATKQATKEIVTESLLSALIISLKYEFGFGRKRMQKVTDEINNQLNLIHDKIVEHEDMIKLAEEIRDKLKLIV
jgi:hypothetical protein